MIIIGFNFDSSFNADIARKKIYIQPQTNRTFKPLSTLICLKNLELLHKAWRMDNMEAGKTW